MRSIKHPADLGKDVAEPQDADDALILLSILKELSEIADGNPSPQKRERAQAAVSAAVSNLIEYQAKAAVHMPATPAAMPIERQLRPTGRGGASGVVIRWSLRG